MRHTMRAIQLKTKPSRTLLITGVKDIGLRTESIDCGSGVFASGKTSVLFQSLGTWPSLMEELKMEQTGLEMIDAQSFTTQFRYPVNGAMSSVGITGQILQSL